MPRSAVVMVALLLAFSASGECAVKAGFQARITQHALDYANQKAVDALADQVRQAKIPDQSGSSGDFSYSLSNVVIKGFSQPSSSIKVIPNVGLFWSARDAGIRLHSDWNVHYGRGWLKASMSGSVDVSVNGVSFSLTMVIGTDPTGRLAIKAGGCHCDVADVSVHIHGDLSFVLNLFRGEVERQVRDLLPGKLCDAANDQINNDAENQLRKVRVLSHLVRHLFTLDYRMVAPPSFQPTYMETFHKGEILWTADPQPPPFPPSPLPPSPSSRNMLYLWVGKYVPQSMLYAAHKHGFLRYNVTTKDLPLEDQAFLNTTCSDLIFTCIGRLFPPLGKKYPGLTTTLRMNSTMVPEVSMSPNVLGARLAGDIAVYVNTPAGPSPYVLTVHVSAVFNTTAKVDNQQITGSITGHRFKVTVVDSAVGPVKSKVVQILVRFAMNTFIIPKINEQGEHGFPLPISDSIRFTNTQLHILQDALMIGTDLRYSFLF
ncbi:bactericidal permeability-increasing protein-like [Babylonia areolata]|uniref:bactericidal permeability-increasing protein-like n=1 Tax=Babylonia areolata TaxID=304850 RepID=UPI003FD35AB4